MKIECKLWIVLILRLWVNDELLLCKYETSVSLNLSYYIFLRKKASLVIKQIIKKIHQLFKNQSTFESHIANTEIYFKGRNWKLLLILLIKIINCWITQTYNMGSIRTFSNLKERVRISCIKYVHNLSIIKSVDKTI